LFIFPEIFEVTKSQNLNAMHLLWDNKQIKTNQIVTIFKKLNHSFSFLKIKIAFNKNG
jgi:hypothetical protein